MAELPAGSIYKTKRNGSLEIIKDLGWDTVLIKFLSTGFETVTRRESILKGNVRDPYYPSRFAVGYEGVGKYLLTKHGEKTEAAKHWKRMLERCYCPKQSERFPHYIGCVVCDDWYNFQNFAEWFYRNYPNELGMKYELDKDKLGNGKLYSPETCCFLTRAENNAISHQKTVVLISPEGEEIEVTNLAKFCRDNDLEQRNMNAVTLGLRKTHKGWRSKNVEED